MQIQTPVRNKWCLEELGRVRACRGSKVRADWIKGGIKDTCDANSNQLILF